MARVQMIRAAGARDQGWLFIDAPTALRFIQLVGKFLTARPKTTTGRWSRRVRQVALQHDPPASTFFPRIGHWDR